MAKRKYKLKDVYDYLKEYYNLDWKLFQIRDEDEERGVRVSDFKGNSKNCLSVVAIVYKGTTRILIWLSVSNQDLGILGSSSPMLKGISQPRVTWQDYLSQRYNQEQELITK